MSFLNPLMLLGLAAAAIPVAVHFFNLRRPRRVDFSSLAFVRQVEERAMQRLRLKRWLLLALRVLAVACLALAFAQPVLSPRAAGPLAGLLGARASGPAAMAVVTDNSLSMTRRAGGGQGPLLGQARARAGELAGQMRSGSELHLSATAGLEEGALRSTAYRNADAAREAVSAVETRAGAEPLARVARRAARQLAEERGVAASRELYLLSDLQASTLADTSSQSSALATGGGVRVALVPVDGGSPENVAVTDVSVESRVVEVGQPARLTATLENFGEEPRERYGASVYLEGERVAQTTTRLGAGEAATVSFTVTPRQRGWLAGRVETEGGAGDGLSADDTRPFVLHVPRERRVLVVQGQDQPAQYVQLALASEGDGGGGNGESIFQTEAIGEGQLAGTDLPAYDAVVLVGPQSLASGTREALARYVEGGGGLLLFPGSGMQRADYNALLGQLGGGQITGVRGGGRSSADDSTGAGASSNAQQQQQQQRVASFERVDTDHPLFEGVFDPVRSGGGSGNSSGGGGVERPELYRVADYAAGADASAASGAEQTLIRLTGGRPFLQEIRHGEGTALFMAAAPNEAWSDLPTRGLFVPLLYRSLFYLSSSGSTAGNALTAGQPGELRVRATGSATGSADGGRNAPLRLVGPGGEEVIPEQRSLFGATLLETGGQLRTPGVYDVRQGDALIRRVALGLDPAESDVRALAPEDAARRLSDALGTDVRVLSDVSEGGLARTLRVEQAGVELWNVFLLLALLFLVAEMLVARHWTPEQA